jgi:hypothetical protein
MRFNRVMAAELFDNAAEIVEDEIRDIWPTLRGADILLFQNDLFYKIRQLETKCEGGSARGFLPASFIDLHLVPNWTGGEQYESAWNELIGSCNEAVLEQLDVFEEHVCDWIEDMIPEELNFFTAALDQGILNAEWLEVAAEQLKKPVAVPDAVSRTTNEISGTLEIDARDQLPEIKEVDLTRLAYTRRRRSRPFEISRSKPSLRKTRRKSPI